MARAVGVRWGVVVAAGALLASCVSGGQSSGSESTTTSAAETTSTSAAPPSTAAPGTPTSAPSDQPGPLPAGFSPVSATFVSLAAGWVLGTGPCASGSCPQLWKTTDGGRSWSAVAAPPAPVDAEGTRGGVAEIRFANADDGWAFRPTLWSTHDGGAHWARQPVEGVEALEATTGGVHAVVIGDGGFRFTVQTSTVHADTWRPTGISVGSGAGPSPHGQLVVHGKAGWVVFTNRVDFSGARLRAGRWADWEPPCRGGSSGSLAAATASDVVAFCSEGVYDNRPSALRAYVSADGGVSFRPVEQALPLRWGFPVAAARPGVWVVGGNDTDDSAVLLRTVDGGRSWHTVHREAHGSWEQIGFTSADQGIAIHQVTGGAATLLMTRDGGQTWRPVGTP